MDDSFLIFPISSNSLTMIAVLDTDNAAVEKFVKQRLNYNKIESVLRVGQEYQVPIKIHYEV